MLKKIINHTRRISPVFLNIVLFIGCIFFVLIIALYQLFVDKNYRFLSFKKFLHPKFLLAILKDPNRGFPGCLESLNYAIFLKDRDIYYKEFKNSSTKKLYSLEDEVLDSGFFVSPNNQKVAFITKAKSSIFSLNIFILGENKIERFAFDSLNNVQIIHWDKDSQKIYLAYQVNTGVWNISFWKEKEFTSLVDGINFSKEFLTYSVEPIDDFIVPRDKVPASVTPRCRG